MTRYPTRIESIEYVWFDENRECIRAKVHWCGLNPRTGNQWRPTSESIDRFMDEPRKLLDSAAWATFTCSHDYRTFSNQYPEEFDFETIFPHAFGRSYITSADLDWGSDSDSGDDESEYEPDFYTTPPKESGRGAVVADAMMEWSIAKLETFDGAAKSSECPLCYAPFEDDDVVSLLPCKHVMCPGCFTKWPRCFACIV